MHTETVTTNIQVRSVDDALARAARERAAASHRSLSGYIKDLIERDLAESRARDALQAVLDEIEADEPWGVEEADVLAAVRDGRRDMGIE